MEIWLFLFAITNNTTMNILTSFGRHANIFLLSTSLGIEWLGAGNFYTYYFNCAKHGILNTFLILEMRKFSPEVFEVSQHYIAGQHQRGKASNTTFPDPKAVPFPLPTMGSMIAACVFVRVLRTFQVK